ncbi:MAG: hemerythrin family protein [Rhodospirillaceae bacterium]
MAQSSCPLSQRTDVPPPVKFIAQCDREHNILKHLYDDIVVAQNKTFRKTTIAKILHILAMYVKFHFDNEYAFMLATGYPELLEHDQVHREFIEELQRINQNYLAGGDPYEGIREIYYGLATGHIPETDARLISFAQTMAATCPRTNCHRCGP